MPAALPVPEATQRLSWSRLLGHDSKLRLRMNQALLASILILGCIVMGVYAGLRAGSPRAGILAWGVLAFCGQAAMVLTIRSGWSLRFADPALTLPQIAFTLTWTCLLYPWAGEFRAAALPILIVILMFGMFQLRARAVTGLSLYTLVMLAAAMYYGVAIGPQRLPAHVEFGMFLVMVFTIPSVSILAARMSAIRYRLRSQREELQLALARIEALARRDALTGTFNRGYAEELLQRALRRHDRSGAPFCVAMLDLDHFKRVNDQHGHAVGDAVLVAFAQTVQQQLRDTDTLTRWGGEEFLLLLDDAGPEAAASLMARVQAAVRALQVPLPEGSVSCRFSAGLAALQPGDSLKALLLRADQALYRAKAEGRDRVVLG